MFGCIAAGRPGKLPVVPAIQTNLTTLSTTQFTLLLPYALSTLNHLVVFLLPETVLPAGTAATVYIHVPITSTTTTTTSTTSPDSKQAEWKLLGAIGNEKPSAIFRVRGLHAGSAGVTPTNNANSIDLDEMTDDAITNLSPLQTKMAEGESVILGISIEPMESVQAQLSTLKPQGGELQPTALVLTKPTETITTATSFQLPPPQVITILARRIIKNCFNYLASFGEKSRSGQDVVPLRAFQEWWTKFEKRVEYDPSFLEREE